VRELEEKPLRIQQIRPALRKSKGRAIRVQSFDADYFSFDPLAT
jgi:hypothetical protein